MATQSEQTIQRLVKRREAAELLAVTPRTLRRYELSGKLPAVKFNCRATRYRLEDVVRLQEGLV